MIRTWLVYSAWVLFIPMALSMEKPKYENEHEWIHTKLKSSVGKIKDICLNNAGDKIAVIGHHCNFAEIWHVQSSKLICRVGIDDIIGHNDDITCIAFHSKKNIVITGSKDHTAKLWDATTGNHIVTLNLESIGHASAITSVCISPKKKVIVLGTAQGTTHFWKYDKTIKGWKSEWVLNSDLADIGAIATIALNSTCNLVIVGTDKGLLHAYRFMGNKPSQTISVAYDSPIKKIIGTPRAGAILLIELVSADFPNFALLKILKEEGRACFSNHTFTLDADLLQSQRLFGDIHEHKIALLGSHDVVICDLAADMRSELRSHTLDHEAFERVTCVRFNATGKKLLTTSDNGLVKVWSIEDPTWVCDDRFIHENAKGSSVPVTFAEFNQQNDAIIITASFQDSTISIWEQLEMTSKQDTLSPKITNSQEQRLEALNQELFDDSVDAQAEVSNPRVIESDSEISDSDRKFSYEEPEVYTVLDSDEEEEEHAGAPAQNPSDAKRKLAIAETNDQFPTVKRARFAQKSRPDSVSWLHSVISGSKANKNFKIRLPEFTGNINEHGRDGNTPVCLAAIHNKQWILNQLIGLGADISIKNIQGETPLHLAAAKGNFECVKLLLLHGASVEVTNESGKTPPDLALENGHKEIALLLLFKTRLVVP